MDTIGLDLHKRESQLCIIAEDGSVTERRITTSRERFTAVLGDRDNARILIEASTESEWVAQHLEGLGHEVIVADPNFAPMYATRRRRIKTDRRDARTLADALKLGAYRRAHRVSAERRHIRAELAVREALVRTRTRYIALAKALVRRDGLRVASSESEKVARRIAELDLSDTLAAELLPLFQVLAPINEQIEEADRRITQFSRNDPEVALLMTAPSIGPITASAIVATVDDIKRFDSAHRCKRNQRHGHACKLSRICIASRIRTSLLVPDHLTRAERRASSRHRADLRVAQTSPTRRAPHSPALTQYRHDAPAILHAVAHHHTPHQSDCELQPDHR